MPDLNMLKDRRINLEFNQGKDDPKTRFLIPAYSAGTAVQVFKMQTWDRLQPQDMVPKGLIKLIRFGDELLLHSAPLPNFDP